MRTLLLLFTIFLSSSILGQSLAIEELVKLNKMTFDEIETIVLKKNFSLKTTFKDSLKTTIQYENKNPELLITISKYNTDKLFVLDYLTFEKEEYLKAKKYCKLKKFRVLGTKVSKGEISSLSTSYLLNGCIIKTTSNTTLAEDGHSNLNWFNIEISDSNNYGIKN